MRLLALDAATEACSVALWQDGVVEGLNERIGRGHAQRLLPMADQLLSRARLSVPRLDGIAFGRGPGGFTGLRIAAALAQGLAAGAGIPLLPVSDLAALAVAGRRHAGQARVIACLDARMGQVYWAAYAGDGMPPEAVSEERLGAPESVVVPAAGRWFTAGPWFGAGPAFDAYPQIAASLGPALAGIDATLLPDAADIAAIAAAELAAGGGRDAAEARPVYLRDEVAHRR